MTRRGALIALMLAAGAASCSGGGAPGVEAPVGAPGEAADDLADATPARWIHHPREAPSPTVAVAIGDGRCVVATEEGERWLVPAAAGDRCTGESRGSSFGAPEPLRRIVRAGGRWRFVGETGTLYEATDPLGAFERVLVPPTALGRVATRGDATVGLSSAGEPFVLEADGWARGDAGGARLFDVDVDDAGRALAIAWPERVLTSTDGGRTFRTPSPAPATIGALAVRAARGGPLTVAGVRGQLAWTAEGALVPSPSRPEARAEPAEAEVRPARLAPRATEVGQGRAALVGRRWYEARQRKDIDGGDEARDASGWVLVRGRVGGTFDTVPLADIPGDREVRLAAHGRMVVLGSIATPGDDDDDDDEKNAGAPQLVLRRSIDEGAHFTELARVVVPDVRHVRLAIAPGGDVLVTAACSPAAPAAAPRPAAARPGRSDDDASICRPRAPLLIRASARGRPAQIVAGVATELRGLPASPAFSPDGARAYFVGRRAKGQEPSIFVSEDGARTWDARPMRRRGEDDEVARPRGGEDESESWEDGPRSRDRAIELIEDQPLSVDADGTVGLVVQNSVGQVWVVADPDGDVRGVSQAPSSSAVLAGSGRRVLAVELSGRELSTWESSDGGSSWVPAGTLRVRLEGDLGVACGSGGCAVGDGVSRLGWDVREGGAAESVPPRTASRPPTVLTPITCELDPKGWGALPGIEASAPFPTLDEIARGRAAWSVLAVDRTRGGVTVHHVPLDAADPTRVTARALLEPVAEGKGSALRTSHQGEGYASARLADGARELELGWVNFIDGTLGRRVTPVPAGATLRVGTDRGLETGIVSVTTGGIFVQPVPTSRDTTFLDLRGGSSRFELPDWPKLGVIGRPRDDASRIGGRNIVVGVIEAGPTIGLLATRGEGGAEMTVDAATIAPPAAIGATTVTGWTYSGQAPGFLVVAADASGELWSAAAWRPFGEDGKLGPPIATPTLHDLPDRPRACRPEELRTSPRAESPMIAPGRGVVLARGRRHPVVVPGGADASTADGALHLLTSGAVLHGSPGSPCLAGWEANAIDGRRAAAVILGDLSRAWVFRVAQGTPSPGGRPPTGNLDVEVRAMTCRWDPAAPVAEGVWDEAGVR